MFIFASPADAGLSSHRTHPPPIDVMDVGKEHQRTFDAMVRLTFHNVPEDKVGMWRPGTCRTKKLQ
jgi:hypothetical protein